MTSPEQYIRAAFDVPTDPRRRAAERIRGAFRREPGWTLVAATPAEVPEVVARADALARAGAWVLGGLRYEAAGAWDAAQATQPSPQPAAHFAAWEGDPEPWPSGSPPLPALDWRDDRRFGSARPLEPRQAIAAVRAHIAAGDCYQVNLTTRLRSLPGPELFTLFAALAAAQPGGYAVFLRDAGALSVSPELFFSFSPASGVLRTQPMKGTAARGRGPAADAAAAAALRGSPKDRAENLMIVDLLRNDLSRICEPGSVCVEALFELLELPTVWQMTSTVAGRTRPRTGLAEVMGALFPCGSVTGAPKVRAMEVIRSLEPAPRGWYCGALGVIRPGGEAIFNVPIRTVDASGGTLVCGIGSGVVADSDPVVEEEEWRAKQRFLGGVPLEALETMLLEDGRIARLDRHLRRLARTCAAFDLPLDADAVAARLAATASAHPAGRLRVRLRVGRDGVAVEVTPAPVTPLPVRLRLANTPLDTAGFLRPVIVNKTTHRAHWAAFGPAGDAFDLIGHTPAGELTECATGTLALLLDGAWLTPPAAVGLLPGTLREELLESGRLREAPLRVEDLARAQEVAFLNSLRGWCPAVVLPAPTGGGHLTRPR